MRSDILINERIQKITQNQEQDGVNPPLLLELISGNAVIGNKASKRKRKNVHVIHVIVVHTQKQPCQGPVKSLQVRGVWGAEDP
jgi:hypothetical protein